MAKTENEGRRGGFSLTFFKTGIMTERGIDESLKTIGVSSDNATLTLNSARLLDGVRKNSSSRMNFQDGDHDGSYDLCTSFQISDYHLIVDQSAIDCCRWES